MNKDPIALASLAVMAAACAATPASVGTSGFVEPGMSARSSSATTDRVILSSPARTTTTTFGGASVDSGRVTGASVLAPVPNGAADASPIGDASGETGGAKGDTSDMSGTRSP